MDKKSTKYTTPSSSNKGTPTESKKNQASEIVNGKLFPKTSRKRESPGNNTYSKNELPRKSGVQNKTRSFDKRPKPKRQYHGSAEENTKVDGGEIAELGSVMASGSKKQNLNHLLNFHYEPREVEGCSGGLGIRKSSRNYNNSNRWLPPVQRHKYNKELFLQANCQFVVNICGDYTRYLVDPDSLVDWNLIEQIRVDTSESLTCPICLCSPLAAKMTQCGHVYCWPCLLHYLSLSDKSYRKCPICFEYVHRSDLKSVVEITRNPVNIGDEVTLRLMRRKRGSLLAVPVEEVQTLDPDMFFQISEHPSSQIYSKLLLANPNDIMKIIGSEREQLRVGLIDDPHSPENCFIEQALRELDEREKHTTLIINQDIKDNQNEASATSEENESIPQKFDIFNGQELETDIGDKFHNMNLQSAKKFFYFYQSDDGQHLYLHAMNVKMLELQYGNLELCPRIISGKLLEKESGSFTEDLRKRMRYLCHLPLTCTFEIAEIELTTPLISNEVLELFQEQLELREKCRKRREREEKKREKKITAEENKWMGKYPTPNVHIESRKHFPQWQPDPPSSSTVAQTPSDLSAASSFGSSPDRSLFDIDEVSFTDHNGLGTLENVQDTGPSFAQMLQSKDPRISARAWPAMETRRSNRNFGKLSENSSSGINAEDDHPSVPIYNQSFGDVLAQALEQTTRLKTPRKNKKKK